MFSTKNTKTTVAVSNIVKSPNGAVILRANTIKEVFSLCMEKKVFSRYNEISYRGMSLDQLSLSALVM